MTPQQTIQEVVLPLILSCLAALFAGPPIIRFLHREKVDQTELEEGLESHKKKSGTPTMGGFIFLIPTAVISLFYIRRYPEIGAVLLLTAGFALTGFLDDFVKVFRHRNMGLNVPQKLAVQLAAALLFLWYLSRYTEIALTMRIPFFPDVIWDPGILKIPAFLLICLATVNGTNFTDGVDGLCGSVTAVIAAFFVPVAFHTGGGIAPLAAALCGALLGYLFYNVYPGRIMMGDTGSLAIGGLVTGMAYVCGVELFIPIFGFIYAAEVLSVVLQVGYFKLTKGKRIFRMAPIHHHYEKGGWSETRVVNAFTTATVLGCLTAYAALF